ncbi:3-deoxy-8-phosphooctulonate synthase [Desulforegula conservatrix]|uniref:3-deoxy-8-phosphooctulonate synthase n=1 Tax=Desulforegula conservatrix TaxID=153026 RepID=UPI00041EAB26|nr:3-deoxy-8-phosphooctulonate synthase [Desulforegula conservatrix]
MNNKVTICEGTEIGSGLPLCIIAGPCVIEEYSITLKIAKTLKDITTRLGLPFIFKASYDKANRTSISSFRGPGIDEGLEILNSIKKEVGVPVTSDIHLMEEAEKASKVLDLIQIPAFLCRQTDFILAAARTGKPVNIKKGQFLAPWDMANVIKKAESTGNKNLLITERGASFGYNNLVSDMRSIPIMQKTGCPVVFDATHSVQLPGGQGDSSGGNREFAPVLARAAVAAGADAVFMEIHPDPDKALCDGPNSLRLDDAEKIIAQLAMIRDIVIK